MNRIFENKLFPEIEEFFASKGFTVLYEDIEGKNVLIMEPDSDVLFEDCNITVDSFDEESTAVNILFTLESKLPDEFSDNVDDLLLYLNKYLTIGCFELIKENGFFFLGIISHMDNFTREKSIPNLFLCNIVKLIIACK